MVSTTTHDTHLGFNIQFYCNTFIQWHGMTVSNPRGRYTIMELGYPTGIPQHRESPSSEWVLEPITGQNTKLSDPTGQQSDIGVLYNLSGIQRNTAAQQ